MTFIGGDFSGSFSLSNKTSGSQEEAFILYAKEKILDFEVPPNSYQLVVSLILLGAILFEKFNIIFIACFRWHEKYLLLFLYVQT